MTGESPASGDSVWAAPVRVRCDGCGPRIIALSSLRLLGRRDRWEYAFTCSGCGSRVRRPADDAMRAALRDAGAAELSVRAAGVDDH